MRLLRSLNFGFGIALTFFICIAVEGIYTDGTISLIVSGAGIVIIPFAWAYSRKLAKQKAAKQSKLEFFESSLDMLCIVSADWQFITVNSAFENALGFTKQDFASRPFMEFVHPDDREKTAAISEQVKAGGAVHYFENRYLCKDGGYKWLGWSTRNIGGVPYASARDITEQKKEQERAKLESDRLAAIIQVQYEIAYAGENAQSLMTSVVHRAQSLTGADGAVIEIVDGTDLVYRAASGAAAAHLGLRLAMASSFSGKCAESGEALICDDTQNDPRVDRAAAEKLGMRSLAVAPLKHGQKTIGVLKVYSLRVAGFDKDLLSVLQILSGFLAVMLDRISASDSIRESAAEIKKLNAELENRVRERTFELEDSHNTFKSVTENIDDVLWLADGNRSKMLYVNPAFEKLWGLPAKAMMEKADAFMQVIHPEDRSRVAEAMPARPADTVRLQFRIIDADIQVRWVRATVTPIKNASGEVYRQVGIFADITDFRNAVLAEQSANSASNLKSEFLANMSHEIRTPLNGVVGNANLLMDTDLSQEQKEFASGIVQSADTLLALISDILDLSKAESGKMELENITFDLAQVFRTVESALAPSAGKKGLQLSFQIGSEVPRHLQGDPTRLTQILMNLVNNAIKFTREGHIRARVYRKASSQSRCELRFEVEDTGIGIPEASIAKLFLAFSQADASTTRKFGGTGLGLSISKRLVNLMGGTIGVNSTVNQGSTFWFEIPYEAGALALPDAAHQKPVAALGEKLRILVAEDNPVNQTIALKMLTKMGHVVTAVNDGSEALEALKQGTYDVVFMDCQMPVMDGYEATGFIRTSKNLNSAHIKVIAMTAHAMKGDREKCLAAGMDDYISKPITRSAIQDAFDRVFAPKKAAS